MINDFYDSDAVVRQVTTTKTPMGSVKKDFSTRIASLPCRISTDRVAKQITETDEFGKMTIRGLWRLYCEASTTNKAIEESDRILLDSRTFEITGIANPGMQDHHLEIDLLEVR